MRTLYITSFPVKDTDVDPGDSAYAISYGSDSGGSYGSDYGGSYGSDYGGSYGSDSGGGYQSDQGGGSNSNIPITSQAMQSADDRYPTLFHFNGIDYYVPADSRGTVPTTTVEGVSLWLNPQNADNSQSLDLYQEGQPMTMIGHYTHGYEPEFHTTGIRLDRVSWAAKTGSHLEAMESEEGIRSGSVLLGRGSGDTLIGHGGWDIIDARNGNDTCHGGGGRDIIDLGEGIDEGFGGKGWNTFLDHLDNQQDVIVISADRVADGSKVDTIERLDAFDQIIMQGTGAEKLSFSNTIAHGLEGIGIYVDGMLEACYIGGDLSTEQIQNMTSGDASQAAIAGDIFSYRNPEATFPVA